MDAVIYTKSIPEYEMLSGIFADELSDVTVSRGVIDREYHLEREYDVVVVARWSMQSCLRDFRKEGLSRSLI